MKKSFKSFFFLLAILIVPALCQGSTVILTKTSQDHTITSGRDEQIYGTSASNQIILENGAKAELFYFPGQNSIQIQSSSDLFTVSRSGSVVTFQGSDGTVLKIPATTEVQTISFNGEASWMLQIHNSQVMLDDHVVTTQVVPLDSFSDVSAPDPLIADDYNALSDFTKATYLAKLSFMSVMSNGFEEPYGVAEPKAEYVAAYADSHTHVLESLDNVTAAVERINAAREEPGAYFTPSGEILFRSAEASAPGVFASDDYTDDKIEDSFLIKAWDFLVKGLGGSASRSRERITNTLDQLSEEGKREAYRYALTARGIMNRDDVEDNADDFWANLKQGKYDNQCAVLYNDLTAPSAIAADIEFADVAERNSASGNPAVDAVVEEGSDLIESGKNFNPGVDGNVLKDEIEDLVGKEMQEEVEKFQEHTKDYHYGDTDNAVESFADSVENAANSGAFDPEFVENLSKATKKAVDAIVPADDGSIPLDQGLLTVSDDAGQTEHGNIVIAEGEDAEGNPSVYISDMAGGTMTVMLPEGFWEITTAGVNSVVDSISAQVQAGLETLATVDTSEEQPADPVMEISTTVTDEDVDFITYRVTATVSGITGPTDVILSLQNAQTWGNTSKSLSADGTVTWSVTVLENNGVITVTRSDTNEGQSLTLSGKKNDHETTVYDGHYVGRMYSSDESESWYFRVEVTGSTVTGRIEGTLSGNQITGQDHFVTDWVYSGTISGDVMSGTWYYSFEGTFGPGHNEGTFSATRQ